MLQNYRNHLHQLTGFSLHTISCYEREAKNFLSNLQTLNIDLMAIDEAVVSAYFQQRSLLPTSINHYLSALKYLYDYLFVQGIVNYNPINRITREKTAPKIHQSYSVDSIKRLLNKSLAYPSRHTVYRDRAIIELLYASGIRASELCHLCVADIDFEHRFFKVTGKGRKERMLPIHEQALKYLRLYLNERMAVLNKYLQKTDGLFLSIKGKNLNRNSLREIIKRHAKEVGLDKSFSTHTLRHAFASHLIESGANLLVVSQMLGHENIETTQIYLQLKDKHIKQLHQQHHPRA